MELKNLLFGLLWVAGLAILAILVVREAAKRKASPFFYVALSLTVGTLVLAATLPGERMSGIIGGFALLMLGSHFFIWRGIWIKVNQQWSGSVIKWHRDYAHSRAAILSLATVVAVLGIGAIVRYLLL